ncbi:hypothetical protein KO488_00765 [Poseidonibacter lekithochrous]|uniref:hypothetical protein n=1 Tax=Poseidonibacter TaxID=2321187 RepID=UPI001C083DEB|nr:MULTISPECIES: hypothetical protein [Poseidonibacter]MBU3013268.1 hypothetical protein [Poseidonibacter lekithochrous]MDO6826565.1 hypothetical protein [Poseidonibacter sp. 1_MG-2023]
MSQELEDLLKKFSTELKYNIPIGLLPEEKNEEYPYEGIEIALVLYWSYKNKLLIQNMQDVFDAYSKNITFEKHQDFITMMKEIIGIELDNIIYNEYGKEFVVDYVAFTSQWKYRFYDEIDVMFSNIRSFSQIPQNEESYKMIFDLLDKRYKEYMIEKDFEMPKN